MYRCDNILDCPEGTDEMNCQPKCLRHHSFLSDEVPLDILSGKCIFGIHACTDTHFTCEVSGCVSLDKVCDQKKDCKDGSDEDPVICKQLILTRTDYSHNMCLYNPQVSTNQIIPDEVCEYDECSRKFKCYITYCIPFSLLCDGKLDCPYGEDEENCATVKCVGLLQCRDSTVCVHPDNICDGILDCIHKDDELVCPLDDCPDNCICWGFVTNCSYLDLKEIKENTIKTYTRSLIMSNNKITHVTFDRLLLPNLKVSGNLLVVNLSHNSIASVDEDEQFSLMVVQLDLRFNPLSVLKKKYFSSFGRLLDLLLSDNPLHTVRSNAFAGLSK